MGIRLQDYNPGMGYKVREYLGSGAWKSAFIGSAPGRPEEVALLCYQSGSRADAADDVRGIIKLDTKAPNVEYLATLHAIFNGQDGRLWIAEELLTNPLSNIGRLYDVGKFTRIARDLSRGLKCIHDQGYVHRDMKLDNCGISYNRAKIFDLGSLVTEPGPIGCTIITRAPELLLNEDAQFLGEGDVWALGATLYALCKGTYPFVNPKEVKERARWNEQAAAGTISQVSAARRKRTMDERIRKRAADAGAEEALKNSVRELFGGEVANLLVGMLVFDPVKDDRLHIDQVVEGWDRLAGNFAGAEPLVQRVGEWERIRNVLTSVLEGKLSITYKQLKRVTDEWQEAKAAKGSKFPFKASDFEDLLTRVREAISERYSQGTIGSA